MKKKVAVLAVDPVNGAGLFQYLESFYEKGISYKVFAVSDKNKLMIGHCAASLIFEIAGITEGKRLAVHPLAKPAIQKGIATNDAVTIDGNFYTAQDEHAIPQLIPCLLEVLQ